MTGGGDAPGLNSVLEGFVSRAAGRYNWKVFGSEDGFEGLIQHPSHRKVIPLDLKRVKGIAPKGGSILGCSNVANPWAYPVMRKGKKDFVDVHKRVLRHLAYHKIDALIMIGGDGTMSQAKRLADMGVKVVGVPKTIDNDLVETDYTFGFNTALFTATWALDRLHTTAHAHDRVLICEVMGRYAGWIALESGIASAAHCILIPEINYDIDRIIDKVNSLGGRYSSYAVIVCSEGAREIGGSYSTEEKLVKTKDGKIAHLPKLSGAAERLAAALNGKVKHDVRVTVLGHIQRGGSPTPYDRILGLRFGVAAADLVEKGAYERMVALRSTRIIDVPFKDVIGKQKLVDPDGQLVRTARSLGIELGG